MGLESHFVSISWCERENGPWTRTKKKKIVYKFRHRQPKNKPKSYRIMDLRCVSFLLFAFSIVSFVISLYKYSSLNYKRAWWWLLWKWQSVCWIYRERQGEKLCDHKFTSKTSSKKIIKSKNKKQKKRRKKMLTKIFPFCFHVFRLITSSSPPHRLIYGSFVLLLYFFLSFPTVLYMWLLFSFQFSVWFISFGFSNWKTSNEKNDRKETGLVVVLGMAWRRRRRRQPTVNITRAFNSIFWFFRRNFPNRGKKNNIFSCFFRV